METFPKAEAVAADRGLARPADRRALCELRRAGRRRLDRAGASGDGRARRRDREGRRQGDPARRAPRCSCSDLESYFLAARLQERYIPAARRLRPVEVTETLAQTTKIEMDLRLEAAALSELAENTEDDPGFRVPAVDWERTGRDVVTMEWIDGIKMSDVEALRAAGHDLKAIAATLVQSFLRHTLRDGFFHADMHPGQSVRRGRRHHRRRRSRHCRAGSARRSAASSPKSSTASSPATTAASPRCISRPATCRATHDVAAFAQAIRAIGEPIHGQPAETISMARLLTLLFEVTELFDMETRPELVLLQKTMVVVEGVARTLDPRLQHVEDLRAGRRRLDRRQSRAARPAGRRPRRRQRAACRWPARRPNSPQRTERLSREIDAMAEHGLRFDDATAHAIGKAEARHTRSGRMALWVIALTLVWIAWQLV